MIDTNKNVFGDEKFDTMQDIKELNNFTLDDDEKKGIIVDLKDRKIIRYVGTEFNAIEACTRAGKILVSLSRTNMKYWWNVIILDLKSKCFNITSLIRKVVLRQDVFKFNPFSTVTHRFNSLFYVSMGTNEGFNQLENMGIVYPYTTDGADAGSYLNKTAGGLFKSLAVTLWLMIAKAK